MWQAKALLILGCSFVTIAQGQDLRDPTAPPQQRMAAAQQAQVTDLRLTAIQRRTSGMTAYINGQRVEQGDQLPPYTITKITMDHVIVRHAGNGGELKLSLYTQSPLVSDTKKGSGGQN
ncbi:hypothetical protein ACFOD1_01585 [Pseudidiomarina halophila]|uniref:MSHA biogenesis protein MshK n=1 Tax=Pseudidiomarina halophila TaxID=1449799 RepID=A0A432XW67_9GAMM|nr:hypothetical protein [Pseudidiomarina halophila]RUO52970.1 hypothetical protein CWI69_08040 [Pseudidiomarina halophila]